MALLLTKDEKLWLPVFRGIGTAIHRLYETIRPLIKQAGVELHCQLNTPCLLVSLNFFLSFFLSQTYQHLLLSWNYLIL